MVKRPWCHVMITVYPVPWCHDEVHASLGVMSWWQGTLCHAMMTHALVSCRDDEVPNALTSCRGDEVPCVLTSCRNDEVPSALMPCHVMMTRYPVSWCHVVMTKYPAPWCHVMTKCPVPWWRHDDELHAVFGVMWWLWLTPVSLCLVTYTTYTHLGDCFSWDCIFSLAILSTSQSLNLLLCFAIFHLLCCLSVWCLATE